MKNISKKIEISKLVTTLILLVFTAAFVLPFVWMISASFKAEADVFEYPIRWIPKNWVGFNNYVEIWQGRYNFGIFYINTIKIAIIATCLQVLVSTMAGYAFAKINFKYRSIAFTACLATLMIPNQVTLVPKFILISWLGIYNTHLAIIILLSYSMYGTFLMRQYMVTVSDSIVEAAKIDGASHFRIFTQIFIPICKPAIATLAILKFIWTWNDFQTPLIYLKSRELFTLPLGMQQFASEAGTYFALVMAAAVCTILPLFIVFLFGQKFILEGMTAGAVKG